MYDSELPPNDINKSNDLESFRVIVPVRNGGARWTEAAQALAQAVANPARVVVVDSESTDGSADTARSHGFHVHTIDARTFNHGSTRQDAVDRFARNCQFVVFLTQDAVLNSETSIVRLLESFVDPMVGGAFGRQVPHVDAQIFETHFSDFNYPPTTRTRSISDAKTLGIKAAYFSNSFAAYRVSTLQHCGGFPSDLILGEDMYVAMQMLLRGISIKYCAEATVRHSHNHSISDEMARYFDFGVFHTQLHDLELLQLFGAPENEATSFVLSELRFIARYSPRRLPLWVARNTARFMGYRLGRSYLRLPRQLARRLSMTKVFWSLT